jgi:hypothetical protein
MSSLLLSIFLLKVARMGTEINSDLLCYILLISKL